MLNWKFNIFFPAGERDARGKWCEQHEISKETGKREKVVFVMENFHEVQVERDWKINFPRKAENESWGFEERFIICVIFMNIN